jgi:Tfp pilus assembly protein PilZ
MSNMRIGCGNVQTADSTAADPMGTRETATTPVLRLDLFDPETVRRAWIPFLMYGGFRVTMESVTTESAMTESTVTGCGFRLGQRFDLVLRLPGDTEPQVLMTRIALIEPGDPATGLSPSIGLHLTARDQVHIRRRIDTLLSAQNPAR